MNLDYANRRSSFKKKSRRKLATTLILLALIVIVLLIFFFIRHPRSTMVNKKNQQTIQLPNPSASQTTPHYDFYTILPKANPTNEKHHISNKAKN